MKAASISELKQELSAMPQKKVLELCLRLARYKKENKELLTYLLFEAHNETAYVEGVKAEIEEAFTELPKTTWYLTKKSLRKILRAITKYSKHTGTKESELEMLLHFCKRLKAADISFNNKALVNLYEQQLKKLRILAESVHEELKFDYIKQINELSR